LMIIMSLTKKENNDDPMAQLRRADYIASVEREMREWREEFKKLYGSTPDVITEEEREALVSEFKLKKIADAPKKKTTDKEKPPEKIYADEEYFEGKKYRDTRI